MGTVWALLRLDVGPPLPGDLLDGDLGLRAVLEAHDHRLLEHAKRLDLALHAAAAPALGLARRADLGQPVAQLVVGGELVEQAALEPAAIAQEAAVGERHVLGLGHLHRDGIELLQVRGAAELPAAGADAVHQLRGVAGADLLHLDPRVELVGEVAHEITEVHALLRCEGHPDAAAGGLDGHIHHLHLEPLRASHALSGLDRPPLALSPPAPLAHLEVGGAAEHLAVEAVAPELGQRAPRAAHLAHGVAVSPLDDAEIADVEIRLSREIVLGHRGLAQPHADQVGSFRHDREPCLSGFAHTPPSSLLKKAHLLRWRPRPHAQRGSLPPPPFSRISRPPPPPPAPPGAPRPAPP